MLDYQLATLATPTGRAHQNVEDSYTHYAATGSHVALIEGDTPLAMTGFNAQIPDMVQVGGVYTPPPLRGRGFARRAVALHLAASGARKATLFSASDMAARAYRAIGFRQIGDWTLMLLCNKERAR
jgi:predicted GNAT family acetyltransferase